jgi:predicted P-loop ATPase
VPQAETSGLEFDEVDDDDPYDDSYQFPAPKGKLAKTKPVDKKWAERLTIKTNGDIKADIYNATLLIANDVRIRGRIEYDLLSHEIVTRRTLGFKKMGITQLDIPDDGHGRLFHDSDDNGIRLAIATPKKHGGHGVTLTKMDVQDAVLNTALGNQYHPVRDYLNSLKWDGKKRVEMLFIVYLGLSDNAYTRETSYIFFLAAVARVFEPGCKYDLVPILGGAQGTRKSTFIRTLARGVWFRELAGDFENKGRMMESFKGGWICESPELSGFSRSEVETIKQFFAGQEDQYRLAYAKRVGMFKRQIVTLATTNKNEYLRDPSGNRRFLPHEVRVEKIDIARLETEIDQVWAEALQIYLEERRKTDGDLFLDLRSPEAIRLAVEAQEGKMVDTADDGLAGKMGDWLDIPCTEAEATHPDAGSPFEPIHDDDGETRLGLRNTVAPLDIWIGLFKGQLSNWDFRARKLVSDALKQVEGWEKPNTQGKFRRGGTQHRGYVREGYSAHGMGPWTPLDEVDPDWDLLR